MNPVYPGLAAATLYLIGASIQIRAIARSATGAAPLFLPLLTIGVAAHAVAVFLVMNRPDGVDFGVFAMGSLVALILVAFTLVAALFQPVGNLLTLVAPVAACAVAAAALMPGAPIPYAQFTRGLLTHALLSVLAYTLLAMAACQAIALTLQERFIKRHRARALLRILPPLETMESLLFQQIWAGFVLLTLSVTSGFLFLTDLFAQHVVHHTVLASASWIIYLLLLIGRHAFGWRGTTATRWTLTAFALLVLAYFGSKFVLEILLGRG